MRLFKSGISRQGIEWTAAVRYEDSGKVSSIGTIPVAKKWGYLGTWS